MSSDVPELFSARRARFLSGLGQKALASLPRHGAFRQVARADLEHLMARKLTAGDWDKATIAINRDGLAQRAHTEDSEAA